MTSAKKQRSPYKPIYSLRWQFLLPLYEPLLSISGLGKKFKTGVANSISAELENGETVVDIGCGTGILLEILKKKYPKIQLIGIDPDKNALLFASRRLKKKSLAVELKQLFAEKLSFSDESVDVCFSVLTFHHMPPHAKRDAMREIYRILKPGGKFILTDWGKPKVEFLRYLLLFEKQEYLNDHARGLIPVYLAEAGFTILEDKKIKPTGIYTWISQK